MISMLSADMSKRGVSLSNSFVIVAKGAADEGVVAVALGLLKVLDNLRNGCSWRRPQACEMYGRRCFAQYRVRRIIIEGSYLIWGRRRVHPRGKCGEGRLELLGAEPAVLPPPCCNHSTQPLRSKRNAQDVDNTTHTSQFAEYWPEGKKSRMHWRHSMLIMRRNMAIRCR
jgi:hypothetical protein